MLTSEAQTRAHGIPLQDNSKLPEEFRGVRAIRMNDNHVMDVEPKPGLKAQWVTKPRGGGDSPIDQVYMDAEENGWRKARIEDIAKCRIPFDGERNGYFKMDVVLMVNDRDTVLGYRRSMYEDAQARVGVRFEQGLKERDAQMNQRSRATGGEGTLNTAAELDFKMDKVSPKGK